MNGNCRFIPITYKEFGSILDWFMCSDPFPTDDVEVVRKCIDRMAVDFGYSDWVDAYHRHTP